jgi:hypothetical protein
MDENGEELSDSGSVAARETEAGYELVLCSPDAVIGKRIAVLRDEAGLKQNELARNGAPRYYRAWKTESAD